MAVAIDYREFTQRYSREDLIRKVEQAPVAHAEAVVVEKDFACLDRSDEDNDAFTNPLARATC